MDIISYALSKKYTDGKINEQKIKVAKVEKELDDYQKTMASVNINQEPKQKVSGYGVVNLPKNSANGQVSASVKGETRTNLVKNSNMTIDTNGDGKADDWLSENINGSRQTIITSIDGGQKIEVTHTGVLGVSENYLTQKISVNEGEIWSFGLESKYVRQNGANITNKILIQWLDASEQIISTIFSELVVMEKINWEKKIIDNQIAPIGAEFVRITLGIRSSSSVQLNEKATVWYRNVIAEKTSSLDNKNYISTGTKSTISAMRFKSINRNFFNKNKIIVNKLINIDTGALYDNNVTDVSDYILIPENTNLIRTNGGNTNRYAFYDKNKNFINGGAGTSFVSPSNAKYLIIGFQKGIAETQQVEKGTVSTPYEPYIESTQYITAKDSNGNIVELRSLLNDTKDEIRPSSNGGYEYVKRVSDMEVLDETNSWTSLTENANTYYMRIINWGVSKNIVPATNDVGTASSSDGNYLVRATPINNDYRLIVMGATNLILQIEKSKIDAMAGATTTDRFKAYLNQYPVTLTYQLANEIVTPIQVSGNIVSNPSGTIYIEPVTTVAGIYNAGIGIMYDELPIASIDKISKIDYQTGVETQLNVSKAVIAGDKKSFVHPDLISGNIVFFEYEYDVEGTQGETTIEYYDSRYTLKDSVTGKFYKVVPSVANGVLSNTLAEV